MTALIPPSRYDRALVAPVADWLTAAVAIALPWSTSASGVFIALWLVTALASSDPAALKRELLTPAGGLPVVLWCLGALGMLWADVDWHARFAGLGSFHKLLMIPLLLAQFRRSERGEYVIYGFFISTITVLIVSYVLVWAKLATSPVKLIGIPVHDDIFQNSEFLICTFGVLGVAFYNIHKRHWIIVLTLFVIAALFLVDLSIVTFSRIALAVFFVLVVLLGWQFFRWSGILGACVAAALLGALAWLASPNFRERINQSIEEVEAYRATDKASPTAEHIAFLKSRSRS